MVTKKKPRPWYRIAVDEARSKDQVKRCEKLLKEVRQLIAQCADDPVKMQKLRNMERILLDEESKQLMNRISYKQEEKAMTGVVEHGLLSI